MQTVETKTLKQLKTKNLKCTMTLFNNFITRVAFTSIIHHDQKVQFVFTCTS